MKKNALIVVTGNDKLGDTGKKTGWHLSEVSHVYWPLINDGFTVDFASPLGGKAPLDKESLKLDDPENKSFVEKFRIADGITTQSLKEIDSSSYSVIYFAGGHGTMWDLPDNKDIQRIVPEIFENGGIVAAICHGPSALVNVQLPDGKYLVEGREVNSFTDAEEKEVEKDKIVPFLLESKLRERGAKFSLSGNWENHVVVDGRLITGQNPQSAASLGITIIQTFASLTGTQEQQKMDWETRMDFL